MMSEDKLSQLFNLLQKDRKLSHFSKDLTLATRLKEIKDEVEELEVEVKANNDEKIIDELGDVLWETFSLMILAEDEGRGTSKQIIQSAIDKLSRRKPFILENKVMETKEEELNLYQKAKQLEKINHSKN